MVGSRRHPLSKVVNFGPVTLAEFESMGLTDLEQLEELGWEEVCRRWVQYYPERLNLNAFVGVRASLEGVPWQKLPKSKKEEARQLAEDLRARLGLSSRKGRARSRRSRRASG